MANFDDVISRLATAEAGVKEVRIRLMEHEQRHDEFMLRTDMRLEKLIKQSDEWAGVRKTLAIFVTAIMIIGGFIGWAVNSFWPNMFKS
jgi:uncharacterized protein YhaN